MDVECHYCGKTTDSRDCIHRTVEEAVGRTGGAVSVGGRSSTSSGTSSHHSGNHHGTGSSNRKTTGSSWRYSGGRTVYRNFQVYICNDCLIAEAASRARRRKITAIVVGLLVCWWGISQIIGSFETQTSGPVAPASVSTDQPPAVGGSSSNAVPTSAPEGISTIPAASARVTTPAADHRQLESLPESADAKSPLSSQESAAPSPPNASTEPTIDETYRAKLQSECNGGVMCGEPIRWKLCDGRWTADPPPGQTICRAAGTSR
jgi:hypothetical protein